MLSSIENDCVGWLWFSSNGCLYCMDSFSLNSLMKNLTRLLNEKWVGFWRNSVWISSGWLTGGCGCLTMWLILLYILPRQLDLTLLANSNGLTPLQLMHCYSIILLYSSIYVDQLQKVVLEKTTI